MFEVAFGILLVPIILFGIAVVLGIVEAILVNVVGPIGQSIVSLIELFKSQRFHK